MKTSLRKTFILVFGSIALSTITIAQQLDISFTVSDYNGFNISCFGAKDGSITVTPTGGTPPYYYSWSTGETGATITGLPASYYSVSVKDNAGGEIVGGLNLTEPEQMKVELSSPTYPNGLNVSCFHCANGTIQTTITGGVEPFTFLWGDPASSPATTQNRSNLPGGVYYVYVTDANSCENIRTDITLTEPDRENWSVDGNSGSTPSTQYVGTADNTDLVVKTNGVERMRVNANGGVHVIGQLNVDNLVYTTTAAEMDTITVIDTLRIGRILPLPGDSGVHFGDSSLFTTTSPPWRIYPTTSTEGGIGIGSLYTYGNGNYSVALGHNAMATGADGVTIGSGIGIAAGQRFTNAQPSSLAVGFNTYGNIPTLFVAPADGIAGHSGKVGIGTTTPAEKLHVYGGSILITGFPNTGTPGAPPRWTNAGWKPALITENASVWRTNQVSTFNNSYLGFGITSNGWHWIASLGIDESYAAIEPLSLTWSSSLSTWNLNLCGYVNCKKVTVQNNYSWCDYVFEEDYKLLSLKELGRYLADNKHLPGIPKEADINESGIDVAEMFKMQMEKIEELSLYVVQLNNEIENLKKENGDLKIEKK